VIGLLQRVAAAFSLLCLFAGASQAGTITLPGSRLNPSDGYYTDMIGGGIGPALLMTGGGANANVGESANDDGFSGPIPLGFVFNFFGVDYTEFWANNNGIVSFGGGVDSWLPGLSFVNVPAIAPYFSDVDTTGVGSGLMHLRNDIPDVIIVTWDQVGYYNQRTDKLNSFQLVIRGPGAIIPAGEGPVGFFYKTMAWESGDAPGDGGFGGVPAMIGFTDGTGNEVVFEGSMQDGVSGIVGSKDIWSDSSNTPTVFASPTATVPEPASLFLVGTGVAFLARKRRSRQRQAL